MKHKPGIKTVMKHIKMITDANIHISQHPINQDA